jgi:hypothetical protein
VSIETKLGRWNSTNPLPILGAHTSENTKEKRVDDVLPFKNVAVVPKKAPGPEGINQNNAGASIKGLSLSLAAPATTERQKKKLIVWRSIGSRRFSEEVNTQIWFESKSRVYRHKSLDNILIVINNRALC